MADVLADAAIRRFITDGYVRLERGFDSDVAAECVAALWELMGLDPVDPSTWTDPVVRVGGSSAPALLAAVNSPRVVGAVDQLVGRGQWQQRRLGYGTFPIRFPSRVDPGDTGWHIDGGFGEPPWYSVNFASRGRALLLLMLFSDVGADDAPTRIRVGSHVDVAHALAPIGTDGCVFVPESHTPDCLRRPIVTATGTSGDVYLCHPFLVHGPAGHTAGSGPASWASRASTTPRASGSAGTTTTTAWTRR